MLFLQSAFTRFALASAAFIPILSALPVQQIVHGIKPRRASDQKFRRAERAFRAAAFRHIPEEWAKRKKAGFMVPFRVWIKEDRYCERVREVFSRGYASEFFDTGKLMKLLDDHKNGVCSNARKIYTVYSFLIWYGEYFVNPERV